MSTFVDQLFQLGGIPVSPGGAVYQSPYATPRNGRTWFVDPNYGSDGGNGKSWKTAFLTMDRAFDNLASGDTIYFTGKILEQLVTPVQVFDVSVIGVGNRPRHADSTPSGGQYASAQWGPPASGGTAAQATVRVLQQGWRFQNILFTMIDANAAGVEIVRNADSGNDERDASHCCVIGNRFAGAGVGVRITATSFTENPFNVLVQGNTFNGNTTALLAASAQPNMCQILDNYFISNTSAITAKFQASIIARNVIGIFTAASSSGGIDVRSGGGNNKIFGNWLGGTYSNAGGYNGAAGDEWFGNFASTGVTSSDPA